MGPQSHNPETSLERRRTSHARFNGRRISATSSHSAKQMGKARPPANSPESTRIKCGGTSNARQNRREQSTSPSPGPPMGTVEPGERTGSWWLRESTGKTTNVRKGAHTEQKRALRAKSLQGSTSFQTLGCLWRSRAESFPAAWLLPRAQQLSGSQSTRPQLFPRPQSIPKPQFVPAERCF